MAVRERIYILPLPAGLVLAALVTLVIGTGYALEGAEEASRFLGLSLFATGLVVLLQTNTNLRGVEVQGVRCPPIPAGTPGEIFLTLTNRSPEPRTGLVVRLRPLRRHREPAFVPVLEPGATVVLRLPLPPVSRGIHALPPLRISTIRPAGFCFAWKLFQPVGDRVILPAPAGISWAQRATASGGDITGVRPAGAADPPARTDWKILARTGRRMVREAEDETPDLRLLRWSDTRESEGVERRLAQLALWLLEARGDGADFLLDLPDGRSPTGAFHEACRRLAGYRLP